MTETLPGAMLSTYLYLVISYTHTNTPESGHHSLVNKKKNGIEV